MPLSVLICTYNRPALLVKALTALLIDTSEPPDEVVVVNGGGADTQRALAPFETPGGRLRVIPTRNVSLAVSQNLGLAHCHGDLIALTDDDAMVAPDWVVAIKQALAEHPEAGAVGGPVISLFPEKRVARLAHFTTFPEPRQGAHVRTIAGVNLAYRRAAIAAVGGLDERLISGEEVDYNWRLLRTGWKVWWDPRIKVYHHDRTSLRGYLRQQFNYGQAYWQTRRLHADLYSRYPRRLRTLKDWLKLAYFGPGVLVEALRPLPRGTRWDDRLLFPLLLGLAAAAHRCGYVYEGWLDLSGRRHLNPQARPFEHVSPLRS